MSGTHHTSLWSMGATAPAFDGEGLVAAVQRIREPLHVVSDPHTGRRGIGTGGHPVSEQNGAAAWPLVASLPPIYPEWLGDRSFCEVHGSRFPYVAGAMANGIASVVNSILFSLVKHVSSPSRLAWPTVLSSTRC